MKINTQELKDAIKTCLIGTSTKDLVVQMAHIVFKEDEILSYNDRVSVLVPFKSGLNCSVPAEDLNKVLSGISSKEIEIKATENEVTIISKTTEAIISTEVESRVVEDFFSGIDFDAMSWYELPKNFLDQLALSRFSTSGNALDPNNLFCVYINGEKIFSGDGHRLSELTLSSEMDEVLIPSTAIPDIISFKEFDNYAIEAGWIHFSDENGAVLSCRILLGDYPDFAPIFKRFKKVAEITIESDLIPVLQNIGGLVEGQSDFMRAIEIEITEGKTFLSGKKEGLRIEKNIDNKHKGEDVVFSISPDFLAYILTITNKLSIGETTAMFTSETFTHLVQLPVE